MPPSQRVSVRDSEAIENTGVWVGFYAVCIESQPMAGELCKLAGFDVSSLSDSEKEGVFNTCRKKLCKKNE